MKKHMILACVAVIMAVLAFGVGNALAACQISPTVCGALNGQGDQANEALCQGWTGPSIP